MYAVGACYALELVFIKVACDGFFFHTNLYILITNVYIVLMIMCRFQRKWMHYINLIKTCHIIVDTTLLANVYLSIYIFTSIRLAVSLFSNAVWFLHTVCHIFTNPSFHSLGLYSYYIASYSIYSYCMWNKY